MNIKEYETRIDEFIEYMHEAERAASTCIQYRREIAAFCAWCKGFGGGDKAG